LIIVIASHQIEANGSLNSSQNNRKYNENNKKKLVD
jgi:hypothetical protein